MHSFSFCGIFSFNQLITNLQDGTFHVFDFTKRSHHPVTCRCVYPDPFEKEAKPDFSISMLWSLIRLSIALTQSFCASSFESEIPDGRFPLNITPSTRCIT